jgi:hypothetical protein
VPILKPVISIAIAGAIAFSAYAHLDDGQRQKVATVEKAVMDTLDSGFGWVSATVAAWVPYRMPQVAPNGDIVIKRVGSDRAPPAETAPAYVPPPATTAATNT